MKPSVLLSRLSVVAFFGATALVSAQQLELEKVERLPTPVMDPASDDAQLAIKRFSLPKDLQAKLWAAEPMLANPVAIDFDEKGRLFVSETYRYRTSVLDIRDYMGMLERDLANRTIEDRLKMQHEVFGEEAAKQFAIESEVVRLVEDKDGDGKADSSRVFADGFNGELDGIASGVLARHGQVWFTDIPSLWRLDEQKDGSVKKNELLRGFGVRFNFTGHDFHGLAMGHDGKIYFSIGDRGAHVKGPDGKTVDFPDEGAVYRSNPDGTELEVVHRGLRNPQELVFDEHGNLFTGDNDSDQSDMERLVYVAEGGDSGWRVGYQHAPRGRGGPWIREGLWKPRFDGRPAYLLPPICNIEDGPSGLTYYPGTGLSKQYAGHFFITHFKGSIARSGIQTYTIKQNGATFVPTSSQQFIGGVLPTDVTFGPDGVLYLSDWVDGWPKSQKGRIYGITPVNPNPADVKESAELKKILAEGFTQRGDAELAALLSHPDRRARLEAQLELASRGAKSAAVFAKVAKGSGNAPLARLHAVWGLTQLARSTGKVDPLLGKLLADRDGEVRAQAAKGLGDAGDRKSAAALIKALADSEPRVQYFAAQSLGKLGDAQATPSLLALLKTNADKDAYLRFVAVHALAGIVAKNGGSVDALNTAAKDASGAVRLGVLLVYRELKNGAIAQFVDDADPFIAREAAEAINDAPVNDALRALADKLATANVKDEAVVERALNANYRVGGSARAVALANYAANDKAEAGMRAEALMQLGLWGKPPARDRIVGVYRPLPARDGKAGADALAAALPKLLANGVPENVQLAAIDSVGSLGLASAGATLAATVANESAPEAVRVAALKQLDAANAAEVLKALESAEKSKAGGVKLAALQIVAKRAPERALPIIRGYTATGNEAEQRAAFQSLASLNRPETPALLVGAIDQLAKGKVQPGAQVELIEAVEKSQAQVVKTRWAKQQATWASGGNALAPFSFALAGGEPRRGAGVFFDNAILPCVRCHKVGGEGGDAGPDLSLIGKQHPAEYLLESVVKPSAHIAPGFDIVTFQLANGSTETGSVANETASTVTLKRADGSTLDIAVKDVKQRTIAPSSMPEIYGQMLSKQDLRDLVAFLKMLDRQRGGAGEKFGETQPRAMSPVTLPSAEGGHP
ncbi:MAG TPA: HEAT repeat domain-containing protein [Steroidobacteraceae bacterium]|nr:HEAT repeat domain-containing protein [Steroidobacteraceae bacterium]